MYEATGMTLSPLPAVGLMAALLLSACVKAPDLDWDLRSAGTGLNTSAAAREAGPRPAADANGVISYPGYQVAVARRGDTVAAVASRVGLQADALAKYNALRPTDALNEGEILALPSRVNAAPAGGMGSMATAPTAGAGAIDVTTIATTALDRVGTSTPAAATTKPAAGGEPVRHRVARGETALSIARSYNVSAKSLADWNGLGADLAVREGQYLIIPVAGAPAPLVDASAPGAGSQTPEPPSAKKPLPDEKVAPAATKPKEVPASPDLGAARTTSTTFAMPVDGKIIRGYVKKKNDGIDIAAAAGTPVKAAADGTVAAVTKDTEGTPILVIRHADNILTVYAGVDGVALAKGDKVKRGQKIATVRSASPAFLHFEVRKGVESVDPMPYLQ
jgi:murein DD-endopeptidase MepM/ murein hydrolase activator NlpD